ncbi:hypothetical protein [Bacillus mobilis]|uniref:hypothetical protein n=1 Tax=Bacillus mobilis TaxID=2026190 RepID=UPI002E1FFB9F|nr:hypothetical protein [Bacillus mobilis]MED0933613.1 hypothetical protein [Bacillus mobilis]MED0954183.1 hypothetical protein [Bacillus mobilis]MED0997271.1 hypothetical protein [Bacillus mobilis]
MKKPLLFGISTIILAIVVFITYITVTTSNPLSETEFPKTTEQAKKTAIEYFKKEKQLDVVITEVGVTGEMGYKVWAEGHVVNDEQKKIHVIIDVEKDKEYKVISSKID